APVIKGSVALRGALKQVVADPNFKLELANNGAEVGKGSDLGYVKGTYTVTQSDPKTKRPTMEKGTYLMVYKTQPDGALKIINISATPEARAKPVAGASTKGATKKGKKGR